MVDRPASVVLGLVAAAGLVLVAAVNVRAAPSSSEPCSCELERRRLYLDCLHEHSLGTVVGFDATDPAADPRPAAEACRELAGLPAAP